MTSQKPAVAEEAKASLYGANILSITRNRSLRLPVIIVDYSSQDISSKNGSSCIPYWSGYRKVLTNALVWTSMVVVFTILFENAAKVVFITSKGIYGSGPRIATPWRL
jgi:hypothetical protein